MSATPAASVRSVVRSVDGTPIVCRSLGAGPGVIIVGGSLSTGDDYLRLARSLRGSFAVHVIDRRGRGGSGPLGDGYGLDKECEDLMAVQASTGATSVFGHSYGGLVALETARRADILSRVAVYEPGISVHGSIPSTWMPRYRELLAAGDSRGAFACMVRGNGYSPEVLAKMPMWCVRAILRMGFRAPEWRRMEPLLSAHLAEHEQVTTLDDGTVSRYGSIHARVLLLAGQKSPAFTTPPLEALEATIPGATLELMNGLKHTAPADKTAEVIGARLRAFFLAGPGTAERPPDNGT